MNDNWKSVELLDIVEAYAESEGWMCSEKEVSDEFDIEYEGWLEVHSDDKTMINEEFSYWLDGLCKDGTVHPEQYDKYEYVGKYSD